MDALPPHANILFFRISITLNDRDSIYPTIYPTSQAKVILDFSFLTFYSQTLTESYWLRNLRISYIHLFLNSPSHGAHHTSLQLNFYIWVQWQPLTVSSSFSQHLAQGLEYIKHYGNIFNLLKLLKGKF